MTHLRSILIGLVCIALGFVAQCSGVARAAPILITDDGTVVDGLVTDDLIEIRANNVTLRNVEADRVWHRRGFRGLTVTDSTFTGSGTTDYIGLILQPDSYVSGVVITGHKDGLYIETGGKVRVRDTFIDIRSDRPDNHSDGITLPFAQNFNGVADFIIEDSQVYAAGKTASFNQQGLPLKVVNTAWSGTVYAAEGSRYTGWSDNPEFGWRLYGRPVPWVTSQEQFDAVVDYDVRPLAEYPEPASAVLSLAGLFALRRRR
jgi:hypothetical protein